MTVNSDSEVRDLLCFSDEQLANLVGKTRQAVNKGLKSKDQYFKPRDWLLIVRDLENKNHPGLDDLMGYLRRNGIDVEYERRIDHSTPITPIKLDALDLDKIEAVIPDIDDLQVQHQFCFEQLVSVMKRSDAGVTVRLSQSGAANFHRSLEDMVALGWIDEDRMDQIKLFVLEDHDHFPIMFSARTRSGSPFRTLLTCIDDRFVKADQTSFAKIFNIAMVEAREFKPLVLDPVATGGEGAEKTTADA